MLRLLEKVDITTLSAIALGGLVVGAGMTTVWNLKLSKVTRNQSYIQAAIDHINEQPEVTKRFGKFEVGYPDPRDNFSKIEDESAQFMLPVRGELDNGQLLAYARKKRRDLTLELTRVEVKFNKIPGSRLVVFEAGDQLKPETDKERLIRLRQEQLSRPKGNDVQAAYKKLGQDKIVFNDVPLSKVGDDK